MNRRKLAAIFPGQGAYYKGVLAISSTIYPQVSGVFTEIDKVSKQEFGQTVADVLLSTSSHSRDEVWLRSIALSQLALYGVNVASYQILESHGLHPDTLMGHSFGEIAALACAGAFTVQEGAFIVAQRVKALQKVDTSDGYMAVLGTDAARTRKLLDLIGNQYTVVAAENHAEQTVISGPQEIMDNIREISRYLKIFFLKLESPYPFHSPLLQSAVNDFATGIHHLKQQPLRIPVFSPVIQRYYSPDDKLTDWLAQHLVLPVNFIGAIQRLHAEGVHTFIECGALDTLTKLTKKILKTEDVDVFSWLDPNQDEITSLETLLKELERRGYANAKSTAQRLAELILPGTKQENFNAFWMVMGQQILASIKHEYESFVQNIGDRLGEVEQRRDRGFLTKNGQAGTENPCPWEPATHVETGASADRGFSSGCEPLEVQRNPCPYAAPPNLLESIGRDQLFREITALYAEMLEYPVEVFSNEIQLEAELGIDSVKQTELLVRISEHYQLPPRPSNFRLSNYNTMGKVVDFVSSMQQQSRREGPDNLVEVGGANSTPKELQDSSQTVGEELVLPSGGEDEIAVVGMGLTIAGANNTEEFWKVMVDGPELFTKEVPSTRWMHSLFYSADQQAEDKTYQDTFVFITDFEPTPRLKQEMGSHQDEYELTTLWLRNSLYQALEGVKRYSHDAISLVVGYTADGSQHLEEASVYAGTMHKLEQILADLEEPAEKENLYKEIQAILARRYLRGTNNTSRFLPHQVGRNAMAGILPEDTELQMVDTACSSSLYAIDVAIKGLLMGKQDIAVCGGAVALTPRGLILFAKLRGLSVRGSVRSLDKDSDGVIFSDGAGVVVLKKLRRALQDGDRILAVLKAFGASSNGKDKAICAPSSAGQSLAIQRALSQPGVQLHNLDWIVAHATGTPVGDLAEFTALRETIQTSQPVYVTSNKSLVGHVGWAAGIVSLIEVILGMQKGLIPRQYNFTAPPESFEIETTSLQIPTSAVPWPPKNDHARSASISGFGFGGTNSHLLVEEYIAGVPRSSTPTTQYHTNERVVIVGWATHMPGLSTREEVENWIKSGGYGDSDLPSPRPNGNGRVPESSFGAFYPMPSFQEVRLPPSTVRTIDRCQLMILECARELRDQLKDFWDEHREKTGVFVGHMGATRNGILYANRCYLDDIEHALGQAKSDVLATSPLVKRALEQLKQEVKQLVPASNEDSFPGIMPNVIPARVTNYFDLNGPNMAIDTGFSSALTAFEVASRYLRSGDVALALVGGINGNSTPEMAYMLRDLIDAPVEEQDAEASSAATARLLAEGAFLFSLTTETMALQSGLPILGYVGDFTITNKATEQDASIVCGPHSYRTHTYLGAEGALAVLTALLRKSGQQTIMCKDGKEAPVTLLKLSLPSKIGPKETKRSPIPAQFLNNTEYAPGQALAVKRNVPVLQELALEVVREPIPFLPQGCLVLTDQPALLSEIEQLPADLVVFSVTPIEAGLVPLSHLQITLPTVTPDAVKEALRRVDKPIRHVRVLTNLSKAAPAPECLAKEAEALMMLHDLSFLVLQQCFETLSQGETSFISLFLGALPHGEQHPFTGLFGGLIKCAHLELLNSVTIGIFTSTENVQKGGQQAYLESTAHRYLPVVVYTQDTRKSIFLQETNVELSDGEGRVVARPLMQLDRESVVMAVGGARGITAELLKALAKHCQSHVYLLGSNLLESYPEEIFAGSDEEFAKRRPFYIREQRVQDPEKNLAAINKSFDRMVEARAARKNMSEMAKYCGRERVHYIACDITNREKLAQVIREIMQTEGKVDLLINAAGLNSSGLIREKNFNTFRRIRDLKVQGYQNLKNAFKEYQPRLWCNFSSLISLSGQIGEVDYASANDFLVSASTYASHLSRVEGEHDTSFISTAEFTICWTLWGAAGMGASPLVKAYFERTDYYSAMTTEEGIYHFMREINLAHHVPTVIHLGEAEKRVFNDYLPGFIGVCMQTKSLQHPLTDRRNGANSTLLPKTPDMGDSSETMPNTSGSHRTGASGQGQAAVPTSPYSPDGFVPGFYLDRVLWGTPRANTQEHNEVVFERILDLKRDSYLNNHLVNGYATLPGTFITEIAAEAATQLLPDMHVIAFEDIQFRHFLRVYNEDHPCTTRIHAKITDQTDEEVIVQIRVLTDIVSPDGKILKRNKEHFEAKVILRHEFPPAPYWEPWESSREIAVPDPYYATTSPVLLTDMFVSTKDTRLHPWGKRARYSLKLPIDHPIFSRFLMPTILLDGLARVGVLELVEGEYIPLMVPISIRRLDLYEKINDCQLVAQAEQIELYVTPRELMHLPGRMSNRFVATSPDGKMLLQFKDVVSKPLGYIHRDTKQFFHFNP